MKKPLSFLACLIICLVLVQHRMAHVGRGPGEPLRQTDWDNLGYYLYLPGTFIYNDIKKLHWIPAIDSQYHMIGAGNLYQVIRLEDGNGVPKYLGGVAVMQMPFFFAANIIAKQYGYPPDGFSPPYQWAVAIAALFYALLGVFLLRRFLLYYFKDASVAISLILLCLATNFIQYTAVDGGMSHAYIFPLYVFILFASKRWHDKPSAASAAAIGYIIGLATICRPTEAVMLFIPLLWNTHTKEAAKAKWALVKQHRSHWAVVILFGLLGIAPQLIYWKVVSGSWIYDVGSSWRFLTPFFQVLFGWEKGWFIYTPVTIFFIIGFFFIRQFPWRKSVLWFCILNIYIIISWADWHYGASYSTRALMQSYPVFALPFTALVERIQIKKWRWGFYILGVYLIAVNIFQHGQYSKTILHYYDMNRRYYSRIYLNPNPTPLDMSLLDNEEVLNSEKGYSKTLLVKTDTPIAIKFYGREGTIAELPLREATNTWIRIDANIKVSNGYWGSYLNAELRTGDSIKHVRVRLNSPISKAGEPNAYSFYIHVPEYFKTSSLRVYVNREGEFDGGVWHMEITELRKHNQ